jgi:hypothetical protein
MQSAVGWAEKSPRALLDWSMQRRPSSQRAQLLAIALRTLVKDEPQAVMETVQQLSRGEQQQLLPQVMQQWANNDLEGVTAWMAAAKDPSMRSMAVSTIANIYAQRSPDEAMRWAARLPKSESQYVTSMIISQIAAKDPVRGVALLRTVQDDAQRETAAYNIATNWAHRDPQAALAWATRLPPGQGRNNAVTAVIGQWAVYEPSAALQQIASLDDAGLRDSAALQIISSRRFEDMDLTKQVYSRIQGEQAKKQAAMYLYHGLRESDPAEAERYRREAGLPDNYR